jgi:hypothetical protein
VTGVVGDRCANCHAPLAVDQRYCVNCGQRRGKPRFSVAAMAPQASPEPPQAARRPPPPRPRLSSGATLIAGVATLLIAIGVGVLIGHDSNSAPIRTPAAQVITVGGGAAAGTGAGTGSPTTPGTGSAAPVKPAKTKAKAPKVVHVTAKANKAAAAAVSKVLGSGGNFNSNPTVTQGQSCNGGAGCQGGTFTGNFFGP